MTAPTLTPRDAATQLPLDGGAPPPTSGHRAAAPLAVAFLGYPVLWILGLGVMAFPLGGALALAWLLRRRGPGLAMPGQLMIWFALVAWTATAVFVLDSPDRVVAFAYRTSMYVSAAGLLTWVATTDRRHLPDRTVLRTVSALWFATAVGGSLALVVPGLELTTPMELLLPRGLLDNGLIRNTVHLQIAAEARFLGFPVGRPEAPFPFTNAWGSNLALLTPVVLATWDLDASRRWRLVTGALMVLAVAPWVMSLNRGSWLSLTVGLVYVGARRLTDVPLHRYLGAVAVGAAVVAGVLLSPLGGLVAERVDGPGHSDAGRASMYTQAIDLGTQSPVIGYGAPQPNQEDPDGSSIGTHGQLWLLLVSHGVPAVLLYLGFFASAWYAAVRWRADHAVWLEAVLVIGAIQFPIYELLPAQTITLSVVAAVAIRGYRRQQQREAAT